MQGLDFQKKRGRRKKKRKNKKMKLEFEKKGFRPHIKNVKGIIIWIVEIVLVCLLAYGLAWFFGQRVSNVGDSMSATIQNGDIVLVDRMRYNATTPKRGDIIAFYPNGNENSHYLIKRIVGLPGETVQIDDGKIYIDGEEQTKNIYVTDIETAGVAKEGITLGDNEYFVLGDNHTSSNDSRMAEVGNVNREDIYGKVWFVANQGDTFGFV